MRSRLSVVIAMLWSVTLFAQNAKDIPAFGKIEKSDLELKECVFDKNAEALVLFDVMEVYCSFFPTSPSVPLSTEMNRHVRIKILNDKGLGQADQRIRYYSFRNQVRIKNITAQTYNLDASGNIQVSKLEKKLIYNKKVDQRRSEYVFTFPEVKAGSVIEFKYTVEGSGIRGLDDWYFQKSVPVALSRFTIDFPKEFEVNCQNLASLPLDVQRKQKGNRDMQTFTMLNVPALRNEPYISADIDYLQRLHPEMIAINAPQRRYNLVPSWPQVIKSLLEDEDFGVQLKRNIPRTADLDAELKPIEDPYKKMVAIHRYVQKNMEWDGYYGIWALNGVRSAWNDKKGTCGEINLILVNLLKDAKLNAQPILVSTRENGTITAAVPGVDQFNKVMAHVTIGDKMYILDATDKVTPPHLIPLDVMLSEGLVINKIETEEWGWKFLWNEKQLYRDVIVLKGDVKENGSLEGEVSVSSFDYARALRLPALKQSKENFVEKYFISGQSGLKVDSFDVKNETSDSLPLVQSAKFSMPLGSSGEYKYFSVNLFSGLEKNPFLADSRYSDVFFGSNQHYQIVGNFFIPEGHEFDALPKNIRLIMPDTSIQFTRRVMTDKNQLVVRIAIEFKKPMYSTQEYADFKEFYKKLFDLLNEQFVIRKKA